VNITDIRRLCIKGTEIDRATTFKLFGIIISSDLSWDSHVTYILHKVAKRMYCIIYLVRSGVPTCDILCVYCSVICSVLEYACAVCHSGLTKKLSQDIERVQKRCLKLLYLALSYNQALNKSGLERLESRHDVITWKMFQEIRPKTSLALFVATCKSV